MQDYFLIACSLEWLWQVHADTTHVKLSENQTRLAPKLHVSVPLFNSWPGSPLKTAVQQIALKPFQQRFQMIDLDFFNVYPTQHFTLITRMIYYPIKMGLMILLKFLTSINFFMTSEKWLKLYCYQNGMQSQGFFHKIVVKLK